MLYKQVTKSQFIEDLTNPDYGGLTPCDAVGELYDWLLELGGNMKYDVVGLRCEFSSYLDEDEAYEDGYSRANIIIRSRDGSVMVHDV